MKGETMKIRTGFVSNSSSSSFVAVVPMKIHERVLERKHPYIRAVVEALGGKKTVFGRECFVTSTYSSQNYNVWDSLFFDWEGEIPEIEYGSEIDPYDAYEEVYLPAVRKEGEVFTHSISY